MNRAPQQEEQEPRRTADGAGARTRRSCAAAPAVTRGSAAPIVVGVPRCRRPQPATMFDGTGRRFVATRRCGSLRTIDAFWHRPIWRCRAARSMPSCATAPAWSGIMHDDPVRLATTMDAFRTEERGARRRRRVRGGARGDDAPRLALVPWNAPSARAGADVVFCARLAMERRACAEERGLMMDARCHRDMAGKKNDMHWSSMIFSAAVGRPQALAEIVRRATAADRDALALALLLDAAPHPAAALVAAARMVRRQGALLSHAALAPSVAPALAAWRADPQWVRRAVGAPAQLTQGVAGMVGALRADGAALHDACAVVLRDGDAVDVGVCLAALGAAGWAALDADLRAALLQRAPTAAHGWVWAALDDAQRAAAAANAATVPDRAAALIGRIGSAAWPTTDRALRGRLIAAAARSPLWVSDTAPAWPGMTDDERDLLARAVIAHGAAADAFRFLDALGRAGRATLTAEQRVNLETPAMEVNAWRVLAWRAAAGWDALSAKERDDVIASAEREVWRISGLLHAVGVAGWHALHGDERERLAAAVRRAPETLFRCPPTLWRALADGRLPPATDAPTDAADDWRAEDANIDLSGLPAMHQALVLALAPWRPKDAAPDASRVQRLLDAWDALAADERIALVTAHPFVLAPVAAAARLRGGAATTIDAVGETVARRAAAADGAAAAKRIVGAMLRTSDDWRAWMASFAPSAADPPEVWEAWRRAAQCGLVADNNGCARLAAREKRRGMMRRGAMKVDASPPANLRGGATRRRTTWTET